MPATKGEAVKQTVKGTKRICISYCLQIGTGRFSWVPSHRIQMSWPHQAASCQTRGWRSPIALLCDNLEVLGHPTWSQTLVRHPICPTCFLRLYNRKHIIPLYKRKSSINYLPYMVQKITLDNLIIPTVLEVRNLYFTGESSLCQCGIFSVTELSSSDLV